MGSVFTLPKNNLKMKTLTEMTTEELIALAKQKDEALAAKDAEIASAEEVVNKLKNQVKDKKDGSNKTTVKHDGKSYIFPTESWTEPDPSLAGETVIRTAEKAIEDKGYIAELVKRKFLVELKK
jgi:hypothetical protein